MSPGEGPRGNGVCPWLASTSPCPSVPVSQCPCWACVWSLALRGEGLPVRVLAPQAQGLCSLEPSDPVNGRPAAPSGGGDRTWVFLEGSRPRRGVASIGQRQERGTAFLGDGWGRGSAHSAQPGGDAVDGSPTSRRVRQDGVRPLPSSQDQPLQTPVPLPSLPCPGQRKKRENKQQ